jgi:hypothetical protein
MRVQSERSFYKFSIPLKNIHDAGLGHAKWLRIQNLKYFIIIIIIIIQDYSSSTFIIIIGEIFETTPTGSYIMYSDQCQSFCYPINRKSGLTTVQSENFNVNFAKNCGCKVGLLSICYNSSFIILIFFITIFFIQCLYSNL